MANVDKINMFLSYFNANEEIIFIKPNKARFGISTEIYEKMSLKVKNEHPLKFIENFELTF
jgi:hypothetical protein